MPQKRGSNAPKKGNAKARNVNGGAPVIHPGSLQGDIIGVVLAVLAVSLLVSLLAPSGAVVTSAVSHGLAALFGVGAVLAPMSLFLFALTFFVEGEEPFGTRVAFGLLLVTVAILSLISLYVPEASQDPMVVLQEEVVQTAGGYIGGGVAWMLLSLVGRPVGCVILIGLIVLGIIVCGFSMSSFVSRIRSGAVRLRDSRQKAREQAEPDALNDGFGEDQSLPFDDNADTEPVTSFIGTRTTTVLTRRRKGRSKPQDRDRLFDDDIFDEAPSGNPPTLRRSNKKAVRSDDLSDGSQSFVEASLANAQSTSVAIPDFLRNAASGANSAGARPATARRTKTMSKRRTTEVSTTNSDAPSKKSTKGGAKQKDQRAVAPARQNKKPSAIRVSGSRPGDGAEGYELPPFSMLSSNPNSAGAASSVEELNETMDRLQGTLHEFGLTSRVVDYISGPIVTTFRVEMGEGERVSRIRNLEDDIALTLAAEKVRIFAPIPGTSFVGIEIPNKTRQNVHLGDVLPTASGGPLEVAIGRDSSGHPVVADIAKMPHMLVAGTTGSGKSVMINSMIMSLLMRTTPKQVRLIMIDPKRVEFSCYNGLPHLYVPVVTEPRQAASALQWAVSEMERRLRVFERAGAREIKVYNEMCVSGKLSQMDNPPEPMPYLVVIIDELSDLMMVAGKDVEASIVRIAQLARAAGIHLVIATQRPSANVVTGLIKSNIDNRVALKVSSGIDSRVILDETGAERLLGNGDMLFKYRGLNMQRVLGCYTSDNEINEVVDFIREQAEPDYHEEILTAVVPSQPAGGGRSSDPDADDPLIWEAAQIVVESQLGSTSGLQRRLKVGYSRAGRIMDMLEAKGVVGPPEGSKPREVLLDKDGLEELRIQDARYQEVV